LGLRIWGWRSKGKSALPVCVEVGFEEVMLEFRIGINQCSFGSRTAAAQCHVANLGA
jgi:hypothetical protein